MKRSAFALLLSSAACASSTPEPIEPVQTTEPPPAETKKPEASGKTKRDAIAEELFGVKVEDPYRWLEDEKSPQVQAWMQERDKAAREHLAKLSGREAIAAELRDLLYVDWRSAPAKRGDRFFYSARREDQEKAVVFWHQGEAGEPKVLLDPNTMSSDGSVALGSWIPTWDGKRVAYLLKGSNADESTLHVIEVDTGKISELDRIEGLRYTAPAWNEDGSGFYYTWLPTDPNIPSNELMGHGEIRFHKLGTDPKNDPVIREKTGDSTRWQTPSLSRDGKYLFLTIARGWSEHDVYVMFLKDKKPEWKPLAVGTKALYSVDAYKDRFYVATNQDAPRYRIFVVDPKKIDRKSWKEIVPEDKVAVIDQVDIVGGRLAIKYMKNASSELEVRELNGKKVRSVSLPAIGSSSTLYGNPDEDDAYFSFYSFVYPEEIYKTSIKTGKTERFARIELPVEPSKYELSQVWYPSKDGTKISMFLLHKKGLEKNGANPTLLYGYGGFNISLTPSFSPMLIPWLDRGGVYAVPNLRGGGEYGETWHQAGMLERKQNVFDDFIGAAEWLIANKITRPDRLAIRGGSNGGLLVGVAITQRPELFGGAICAVPLLDMVRYHKFGIGKAWIPEYGNPEEEAAFKFISAYSPYHRVKSGTAYPSLLLMSADSDDRVDPMHARKFWAAIDSASTGSARNLLRIESKAGHGGGDMRKKTLEATADELVFLVSEIGGAPPAAGSAPGAR
jgi:prolyl oligopeptidase